jgi:hypothetical protein
MDNYPQPRPVLYGTLAEEALPRTQTAPVRTGPPRWPPAPPGAAFAPEPGDGNRKPYRWDPTPDLARRPGTFGLMSVSYALAIALSLIYIILNPAAFADTFTGRLVLIVELSLGLLVSLSLWWPDGLSYLTALCPALLQIVIGIIFGWWLLPAFWMAALVLVFLLLPSMRRTYGQRALWTLKNDIARWKQKHPRRHGCRRIGPPPDMPDYWRTRW